MSVEQIKLGYKRTEVGVIPEEWAVERLGDLFEVTSSKRVFQSEWKSKGIPFYRARELAVLGDYGVVENELFISTAMYEVFKRQYGVPEIGDMLVTGVGTLGKTFVVNDNQEFYFKDGNIIWFKIGESISSEFLRQLYLTTLLTKQISDGSAGTTVGTYTITNAKNTIIPFPPLPEQRTIATALSEVDALLFKLDQLIAKKRDLKQAAMQQLLTGQTRLPGFSGAWEVKRMGSLGTTYGGLTGKTKDDFGRGNARYIPFMNVMTDTVIDPNWLEQVNVSPIEAQNTAKKGDLFFNGSSETPEEVGYCSVLLKAITNLYLNSFCFGFRFNPESTANGLFFAYWFRCKQGRKAMSVLAQGATRYNISKSAFLQLEIPQPSADEQTAIATFLSDMDAELAALEARRDKTRSLKQGMMQELLTGRIRLV